MKIYTNYDIWNMFNHNIKLGKIIYKSKLWCLDNPADQLELIKSLLDEEIIQTIDNSASINNVIRLDEYHFKFKPSELEVFNHKADGTINSMQYLTLLANFKQTHLVKIS